MPRTHAGLHRLYVESDLGQDLTLDMSREHANYLATVLRKGVDDELVVFNGRDGAWRARIAQASKRAVSIQTLEQIAPQTPANDLWYGFAPLKSARLDYVVQKATEMGAGVIQPVITRFTQVSRLRADKLTANIIEATEQCEVLSVPELWPEIGLERLLEGWTAQHEERVLVVADEAAVSASPIESLNRLRGRPLGVLVGPEGGFADEERTRLLAQPYVVPISLGPRILRADTAAVAALSLVQATIGDWR